MKSMPAIYPAITENMENLLMKHAPHIYVKAMLATQVTMLYQFFNQKVRVPCHSGWDKL